MAKKMFYLVQLKPFEKAFLKKLTTSGKVSARKHNRCRILLLADRDTALKDEVIATILGISKSTVERIRKRYVVDGLDAAINEKPRSGQPQKLNAKQQAVLIATACSTPPEGRARWTLRLLADKLVELKVVETISYKTVGEKLKKMNLNLT